MKDLNRLLTDAAPRPHRQLDGTELVEGVRRRQRRRRTTFGALAFVLIAVTATTVVTSMRPSLDGSPLALGEGSPGAPEDDVQVVRIEGGLEQIRASGLTLWRAIDGSPYGDHALISGTLTYDVQCGWGVAQDRTVTPLVWPAAAVPNTGGPAVVLADGTVARVGDTIEGAGGYSSDLAAVTEGCPTAGEVAIFNPSEPVVAMRNETMDGTVLREGAGWALVVTLDQALEYRRGRAEVSSVSGFTVPVTLNQLTSFSVREGDATYTLVAGPVVDRASSVRITVSGGSTVEAQLADASEMTWLHALIPGFVSVENAVALDAKGQVVDEHTLPPLPPPMGAETDRTDIGYAGDHTNCNFGQNPEGPEVCQDPATGELYCISGTDAAEAGVTIECDGSGIPPEQFNTPEPASSPTEPNAR